MTTGLPVANLETEQVLGQVERERPRRPRGSMFHGEQEISSAAAEAEIGAARHGSWRCRGAPGRSSRWESPGRGGGGGGRRKRRGESSRSVRTPPRVGGLRR